MVIQVIYIYMDFPAIILNLQKVAFAAVPWKRQALFRSKTGSVHVTSIRQKDFRLKKSQYTNYMLETVELNR